MPSRRIVLLLVMSGGSEVVAGVLYSGGSWDFEQGFYQVQIFDRPGYVGNEWSWWSTKLEYNGQTYGFGVHNENKNPVNISRGVRSQETTMTCATGWAGLFRTCDVPVNHIIRIEYDARTTWSEVPALVFTGTDPTGGRDTAYNSTSTQWTLWNGQPGNWVRVRKTIVSSTSRLTLFIALRHEYPSCSGATFLFDNVEVFDDGPAGSMTPTPTGTPTTTPTLTRAPVPDADNDAVPDSVEGFPPVAGQTNRHLPDSDGDGLTDGREDTNANGLRDTGETSPRALDSDGDLFQDGVEALLGSDANDPNLPPLPYVDADADGLPALLDFSESNPDVDGDRFADGYESQAISHGAANNPLLVPTLGDVNGDLALSNVDALITQSVFLWLTPPLAPGAGHADPSRDGQITNIDALLLQSFFLEIVSLLPL